MTTIWDAAVRAVQPLFEETDQHGHPLAYFCGGPERRCTHRTCDVVCALAAADLLGYPEPDAPGAHLVLDGDRVRVAGTQTPATSVMLARGHGDNDAAITAELGIDLVTLEVLDKLNGEVDEWI